MPVHGRSKPRERGDNLGRIETFLDRALTDTRWARTPHPGKLLGALTRARGYE
jgi:hypothetical protein